MNIRYCNIHSVKMNNLTEQTFPSVIIYPVSVYICNTEPEGILSATQSIGLHYYIIS